MPSNKPYMHGRDHRPGGSDPMTSGDTDTGFFLEADGEGGIRWGEITVDPATDIPHPRFVSAAVSSTDDLIAGVGVQTQLHFVDIFTNDDPDLTHYESSAYTTNGGYQSSNGGLIASTPTNHRDDWDGDYFTHATVSGARSFAVKKEPGIYLVSWGMSVDIDDPYRVLVTLELPEGGAHAPDGTYPHPYLRQILTPWDSSTNAEGGGTLFLHMDDRNELSSAAQPVSMKVTHESPSDLAFYTAWIACTRLNLAT